MRIMLICIFVLCLAGQAFAQVDYFLPETEDLFGLWYSDSDWGDFDNDNDLDLLMVGYGAGGSSGQGFLKFYQNNGNSTFGLYQNTMVGTGNGTAKFADLNGDNALDALICGQVLTGIDTTRVYMNVNGVFNDCGYAFPPRVSSSASFGDYDCDGDLDILMTGGTVDDVSSGYLEIFRNNGSFSFSPVTVATFGIRNGYAEFGDYNNDGWLDIAVAGSAGSGNYVTKVLKGSPSGTFTELPLTLTGLRYSRIYWMDYDCDGFQDLIVSGSVANEQPSMFKLYRNVGNDSFTEIAQPGVLGERQGDLAWGDINNDGYSDVILNGLITNTTTVANMYLYDPVSGLYVDSQTMVYLKYAAMSLGDYNNDTKLDMSLSGYYDYQIYWNDLFYNAYTVNNTAPTVPASLSAQVTGDTVLLAWNTATDGQTPAPGLTYNIRVGTNPGTNDIVASMAVTDTGWRKVARPGNAFQKSFYQIMDLPDDTYYWSVQAIDNGFMSSAFAPVQSFTIGPVSAEDELMPAIGEISSSPNPFSPFTNISFEISKAGRVTAEVFNIRGQLVKTLCTEELNSGTHSFVWNGTDDNGHLAPSGVYTLRVCSANELKHHRLTLIK